MSENVTRVLIVEDESIVALDLQSLLRRLGLDVCGREASGEGAVAAARRERPDLILMDIRLAGEMDGISSAETIREEIDIPIIFLTAYADRQTVERAKASDAYGYLLKPFQEREIEIAIEMAMYKHETERRLRRQQILLDTTLESIPDAVITLDNEERILFANEASLALLGLPEEQLLGVRFDEALSLEAFGTEELGWEEPSDAGLGKRVSYKRRDGQTKSLEMRRRHLEEPTGTGSTVVVLRDISLQIAFEERIEQARRAAEEASKAKSEFISNMSHELRTPMNSILGMSELAIDVSKDEEQREYLSILRRSAEDLLGLISNVLDFSRLESTGGTGEAVPFQLDELLEELAQRQMPWAERKGIYLLCDIDPATPLELLGERNSIASILVNLLSNGLKFTREGGVLISAFCEAGSSEQEGSFPLILEVRDTGIGIPEEEQKRVFDPFTQIDPSVTRDHGGTGIGLAVVRKLVDRIGGEISVRSSPEGGSTFRVVAPVERNRDSETLPLVAELVQPPELLLWGQRDDQLGTLEPWFRRWGVTVEKGVTIDSILSRDSERAAILVAEQGDVRDAPEGFLEAVESGAVSGAIVIGEVESLQAHWGIHFLGVPPRRRHLRHLIEEIPRRGSADGLAPGKTSLSVLIVDDEALSRVAVAKMLESKGHEVEAVSGGEKALLALREQMREVVLLDLEMPDLDGWETSYRIRQELPHGDQCAIVAVTGHSREQERERARVVGMDEFVSKPVSNEELDRTIRSTYSRKRHALRMALLERNEELRGAAAGTRGCEAPLTLIEEAFNSLECGECAKAEQRLMEYRKRCEDSKVRDKVFKAVLACRRRDIEGAQLRLKGMISGG